MRELVAQLVLGTFVFQSVTPPVPSHRTRPVPPPAQGYVSAAREVVARGPSSDTLREGGVHATGDATGQTRPRAVAGIAQSLDFREWSAEGAPGAEAWRINPEGTIAESEAPENDAFLVSPTTHAEIALHGILSLPITSELQTAGVVLGYRAPLHGNGKPQHDYLLLSWRTPAIATPEIRGEWLLTRIRPGNQQPVVLSHVGGSPEGYGLDGPRPITIEYSNRRIRVVVADEEVLDVQGIFPNGRVGLYAAGGARGQFSNFEIQTPAAQAVAPEQRHDDGPEPSRDPDSPDPSVAVSLTKTLLWPADHTWEGPGLKVYVTDPSGSIPSVDVTVYADEPDDQTPGDGNLWPDVELALSPPKFKLRRERKSAGDGRVYLIHAVATGPAGSAFDCASVVVPLTDGASDVQAVQGQAAGAVTHCEANGSAPAGYVLIAQGAFPGTSPNLRVKPIVECVVPQGGNVYTGVFGYQNDNPLTVEVPVGNDNKIAPGSTERGQPSRFLPGRSPAAQGSFAFVFSGSSHAWSVRGPDGSLRSANASSNTVHCGAGSPAVPQAVDDVTSTPVGTPIDVAVLANDSDPQAQALSLARVNAPGYGTAVPNGDGTVTYTPQSGFSGTDAFTYVVTDGEFGWDLATVTVTISGAGNQPPSVDAGSDQAISLPATASLQGTVSDDGLPAGGGLSVAWSQDSGPGIATFTPPDSVTSTATFSAPGTYVVRLSATDSQLSASDTLTMIVSAPTSPTLSIADVTLAEGQEEATAVVVSVTLSSPSAIPVTVRYATADLTATSACDYVASAGDLIFAPGATTATIELAVMGELLAEADETFTVALGDAAGATLADPVGVVTIANDDTATSPPFPPTQRTPAHEAVGVPIDPTLAWIASDPDGDPLTYDVYLGTALDMTGQEWTRLCPSTSGPSARFGSASAYDEGGDRLIVFGGSTDVGEVADVWVLENATGLGGPPRWTQLATGAGPSARQRSVAGYDAGSNRMVIFGGCESGCSNPLADTWVLSNANGSGGTPVWTRLADGPGPRYGHAAAYEAATGRLFVVGGSSGASLHANLWTLSNATQPGAAWTETPILSGPTAREGAQVALDDSGRLYLFGGLGEGQVALDDLWTIGSPGGSNVWAQRPVEGDAPGGRWGHSLAFDPTTRRLILLHGAGPGPGGGPPIAARDAWVLEETDPLLGRFRWTPLEPPGAPAPGRYLAAYAYSPSRGRLVAFGGRDERATPERLDDLWTLTEPIGRLPLVSPGQAAPSYVAPTPDAGATYLWRVVARDVHGAASGSPVWTFTPNAPPVVDAGEFQQVPFPQSMVLRGTVTDDGRPAPPSLSTMWSSGDPSVTIATPERLETTVTFAAPGSYMLTLTASDGAATAQDLVQVQAAGDPNFPPDVNAGEDLSATWPLATGGVIVNHDEWTLSDVGFSKAPDVGRFVLNVAAWMSGGHPGRFLAYSSNFSLTGQQLAGTMTGAGHEWTVSTAVPFTLAHLLQYDGIFVTNQAVDSAVLTEYVRAGGSVYVAGGTFGGPATLYNTFLGAYGLMFEGPFNGVGGALPISAQHPVFAGVTALWFNNGNYVRKTANAPPNTALFHATNGRAWFGIYTHGDTDVAFATALLTGFASDDGLPEPPSLTTTWTQASGPAPAVIEDPAARFTSVWFDTAGTYEFTFSASDGALTSEDSMAVTVAPANGPPFVYAGLDQDVLLPGTAMLTGTAEDDGVPSGVLEVNWSSTSGPAPVTFSAPSSLSTSATFTASGTYVLRLTASDTDLVAHDELTVVVRDRSDLAVSAPDRTSFVVDGQTLQASGRLAATVSNPGAGAAVQPFDVTFFEDRNGNGTLEPGVDVVLGVAALPDLPAGENRIVTADASGQVLFAGNLVHVWVDSGQVVTEEDESNNFASTLVCDPSGCGSAPPDLVPSFVRRTDGPGTITFTARMGNAGGAVGAGVSVSFYDAPPGAGGALLQAVTTTVPIATGAFTDVSIVVPSTTETLPLWVVADDPAGVVESNETNNAYDSRLFVNAPPNQAPVVAAGPDQRLAHPQASTLLDGTVTDDGLPLGQLATTWTVISGPGGVVFGNASDVDTTAAFGPPGTYLLRLAADDGELRTSDDIIVVVEPANQAPSVNAGSDRVTSASISAIDATVTDDGLPTGATLSVQWTQVSGPQPVTFGSANAVDTTVTVTAVGTYVLRLAASDTALNATDDIQLEVTDFTNQAPIVDAGPDRSLTLPESGLTLIGTAVDDGLPFGATVTYAWHQVAGPAEVAFASPTTAQTAATFSTPGTYVVRLRASDSELSAADDVTITIQATAPNGAPPTATLTSPAAGTRITGPVSVVGSALSDSLASWQLEHRLRDDGPWTRFASGTTQVTNGALATLDPTMLMNGMTELRLTVTDTAGRFASANTQVVVKEQQKVGNFTVSFVDLEVPVAGLPIRVTRSYDSRDKRPGDFGHGWRLGLSDVRVEESDAAGLAWEGTISPGFFATYCLASARPPVVTLTLPDGRVLDFQMTLTPSCQPFAPIDVARVTYVPIGNTLGTLTPASGADVYVFASWPGPVELYDASSFSLFDPSVYRYTSPDGRVFVVHEADGLQSVTDLNGNRLTIDPGGVFHSSGKGVLFERDGQGRITTVTDPNGQTVQYVYDANGDLVAHTDRESNTTRFGYHLEFPHHLVSIEDPLGRRPIRNEYDDDGRLVRHIDAFGKTIEYTHQLGIRREIVTDRNLKQRVLDYDERGNVLQETDPNGKVVLRTYDARNNRLTETLPHDPGTVNPPTTTYTYDGADNVLSVTDPENNRTEYTYNTRKQVLTVKDPRGHFTTNVYDAKGNLTSTKVSATLGGPALTETTHAYDTKGNLRTQTVRVDGVPQTTSYAYDTSGNLTQETDATGHLTTYGYDANGNRLRQTTTRTLPGGATETLETRYEYDANGRLLKAIDPDGTFMRSVYDPLGRQVEAFDKLGHKSSSEYDEMGRMVRTQYADLTFEESTYDNEGRRLTSRDRRGKVTTYEYDDVGRLKKTTFPDTSFTENTYDAAGRLTAVRDARGETTAYEYDRAGRRTKVTVPITTGVSAETVFTYDANGNQLTVRDPLLRTTTFEYDELNRRKKTIFHDTSFAETTYDELGRRKTERDQAGRVTTFGYDVLGRLTSVTDARGKVTSYEYDELGNRVRQIDANDHTTAFEYDRLGREIKRLLPAIGTADPAFETKSYDDAGNLEARTDFAGRVTAYTYDVMNRLVARTAQCAPFPCAGAADASFTYTSSGRRETVTDSRGVTNYTYDDRDRLESLTYPDGRSLAYLYDANGNRTRLTATLPAVGGGSATVLTTTYTHDDANRLDLVTDTAGRVYDHGYDLNGNRTSLAQPNGTLTSYVYNTLNRLTNLSTLSGSNTIQGYALTLGAAGNRERIEEADGTARQYGYDELYRLTGETVTIGALNAYTKTFTYDDVGNRMTQATTVGPAGTPGGPLTGHPDSYQYDARDRLIQTFQSGTPSTDYEWDKDGNLVSQEFEATYTWDRENRLLRVNKNNGTVVEHTYDADGARVRTVTTPSGGSASTTHFLVDTAGSLSHVVAETNASGVLQVHYVCGDDLLSLMRPDGSGGWTSRFYHSDHIGSIRRLTDEAGAITDGYTYTAFGELLAHSGTDPQPYAFSGEPYDPNVGFQYHRARWMDPRVGRFVGMDRFRGRLREPATLHRFGYAGADPSNKADPSGDDFGLVTTSRATQVSTQLQVQSITAARPAIAVSKVIAWLVLGVAAGGAVPGPLAVLKEIKERGVPADLYAFGNRTQPRGPRPSDFGLPDASGDVGPESPPLPKGASTFGNPHAAPLTGHYHSIPRGILLPPGLGVVPDGPEFVPDSPNPPTHHTIYPVVAMPFQRFVDKFFDLPWKYEGKK